MFRRVLIANRGEIACRVIRTAKRMGIETVGVVSEADRGSLHAQSLDHPVFIGGYTPGESYLRKEVIAEAALKMKAQAVHPGFGFLSENASFVELLESKGVTFVGPPTQAIELMGSKKESKIAMEKAKVPVVPGYHGVKQDQEFLLNEAKNIGFPVLIKAVMGGGGKGMRIVSSADAFISELDAAKREAMKAFGDDRVILERYIPKSRHIEVQLVGDKHGNYLHFFDRDCTVQRRHQKVIEEAPSMLSDSQREDICNTAIQVAKAVDYYNAGTVEFIYDIESANFYFMEMNTRLQVEHPISEMITGVDLVELQLRVAAGEQFSIKQSDIKIKGHAFESRIYAEEPRKNFLPGSGRVSLLVEPPHQFSKEMVDMNVRVESGVRSGDQISIFYDPMIAKLVSFSPSGRRDSITRAHRALEQYKILGLSTNIEFLKRCYENLNFIKGDFDSNFISNNLDALLVEQPLKAEEVASGVAIYSFLETLNLNPEMMEQTGPWDRGDAYRMSHTDTRQLHFDVEVGDQVTNFTVEVTNRNEPNCFDIVIKESETKFENISVKEAKDGVVIEMSGITQKYTVLKERETVEVASDRSVKLTRTDKYSDALIESQEGGLQVKSPIPGTIVKVFVKEGQKVQIGDNLVALESMKMEHYLKAERTGTIKTVNAIENTFVELDSLILEYEDDDDEK